MIPTRGIIHQFPSGLEPEVLPLGHHRVEAVGARARSAGFVEWPASPPVCLEGSGQVFWLALKRREALAGAGQLRICPADPLSLLAVAGPGHLVHKLSALHPLLHRRPVPRDAAAKPP